MIRRIVSVGISIIVFAVGLGAIVHADTTDSTTYGSGNFGYCNYGSCTITLTSSGTVNVNVAPTPGGRCTVQSDNPSVLTDSTAGYSLTMTTSTTNNSMVGGSGNITASSGTSASPVTLAANT